MLTEASDISSRERAYATQYKLLPRETSGPERLRHILSFRSSPHLYPAQCAISGDRILTVLPPDCGYKVYNAAIEDGPSGEDFARPYDFNRSFFAQFAELLRDVPYFSKVGLLTSNQNSDHCQGISWSKNCYLCFRTLKGEDCLYSRYIRTGKNLVDCVWIVDSELAYGCRDITRCYDVAYCEHCIDCSSSRFLHDCVGCRNCYLCSGLRGAEYCFRNQQLSKSAYLEATAAIDLRSQVQCDQLVEEFHQMRDASSRTEFFYNCEDCSGNNLVRCASTFHSYFASDCVDVEWSIGAEKLDSAFFVVGLGTSSQLLYSCEAVGGQAYSIRNSMQCIGSVQELEYCINVGNGSAYCFGCVGLRRKSYCILNRQYTKEQYFDLVGRIQNQMTSEGTYGRYFPKELSPFAFNRTEAMDFLPLTEAQALMQGYRWEKDQPQSSEDLPLTPDHLDDLSDDGARQRFRCASSGRPFVLQSAEIEFHKRMGMALPRNSPLRRLAELGAFLRIDG